MTSTPDPRYSYDAIADLLRRNGMPEADIARARLQHEFVTQASFCPRSSAYFARLFCKEMNDPEQHHHAGLAYAHFHSLTHSDLKRLQTIVWNAQHVRKTSKLGQLASEAKKIAGPHAPLVLACMLDILVLQIAGADLPLAQKTSLCSILGRQLAEAPDELRAHIAGRCAWQSDPDLLKCILDLGALPDIDDPGLCTPLINAVSSMQSTTFAGGMNALQAKGLECIRELATRGAGLDRVDHHGSTALAIVASKGNHYACHLLLDLGANPFIDCGDVSTLDLLLEHEFTRERALAIQEARTLREDKPALAPAAPRPHRI